MRCNTYISPFFLKVALLCLLQSEMLFAQKNIEQNLYIVFIGDSITYGANLDDPSTEAPPVYACAYLKYQKKINHVTFSNQGISGATTLDFMLPNKGAFNNVIKAADALDGRGDTTQTALIFIVTLGTNDSAIDGPNGAPASPEQYRKNLMIITDRILRNYPKCRIIFNHPTWYSPNTYNSSKYLAEGLQRLEHYFPEIDALVTSYARTCPGHVFVGDTKAFKYFKSHHLTHLLPESGKQGIFFLHPNKKGAVVLGNFWGKAIFNILSIKNNI